MKRILLFLATNFAIVVVLSISMRLLGVEPYLNAQGLNLNALLIFAAVMGFGGSFISLALSKWMAKMSVGAAVISEPQNGQERWLLATVARQAKQANIGMPEVAIWDSPDINAFATGMNKNKALVAVSTGLLNNMTQEEAEAVLGHEVAHVANGDMVTLALIQGVVNTFVIFLSRVIGQTVDKVIFKNEDGHGPAFWITVIVADIVLGILASMIVMWFSRQREFRADIGGAKYTSLQAMIAALERLRATHTPSLPDKMAAFGISGKGSGGFKRLFMTHPPLEERIQALKNLS
ncbi:MAG: protease HtpX [Oleiphilus sp.]|nr:MAG: protease HtpX [Oleiphilus sp.]